MSIPVPQAHSGRPRAERAGRRMQWARLALCGGAIAAVWLGVLPWLAQRPAMHARIEWLDERKIDPSAMYYTELEAMQPILRRLNQRQRAE